MSTLLITGASGFVGTALCRQAQSTGRAVRAAVRTAGAAATNVPSVTVPSIDGQTLWADALQGCDSVIHTAARVHVMNESATDPLSEFRRVNVDGTLNLARQAAAAGVRRFVFVSSIKVNGEGTQAQRPFLASDVPAPQDPYGVSKAEAELGLRQVAEQTGLEVTIVRPPLVYGPGVKANFGSLLRAVQRGLPLPLGAVRHNRRSLVALDNLIDLLLTCVDHPAAAHQTFLVSDGEDLSTTALIQRMGQAIGRPARLLPVPVFLLHLGATVLGKRDVAQRVLGNLQVNIDHTQATLGWSPPITVEEGLRRAAPKVPS